jgi:isoleucyl-tRNA synthetase
VTRHVARERRDESRGLSFCQDGIIMLCLDYYYFLRKLIKKNKIMFKAVSPRDDLIKIEKRIIRYWKKEKIFERSVSERASSPVYSFFDGPPFATGVPHYGTILSSVAKDVVPRYWTMKGYRVDRRWGWDCHGLPAENVIEKKLKLKSKEEIENKVGIEEFNRNCRELVSQMSNEWESIIDRIGRFVDYKNSYKTMDKEYMESVWWVFKEMHSKKLIYEDRRISLYCPRCETPLSNFEIAMDNSYEDVVDASVFVKFRITQGEYKDNFVLAWTTTPWTLPGNMALAVHKKIDYVRIKTKKRETLIIAKDKLEEIKEEFAILEEFKGSKLQGMKYEPLYTGFESEGGDKENLHQIWTANFVSSEEGSGIVHLAAFGEDDFKFAKENNIPLIDNVDSKGEFKEGRFKGKNVFLANKKIITDLGTRGILYKEKPLTHSYPFCYRCHTKLIYKVQPAWFVDINKIRNRLIDQNEKINWNPNYLKHGRFLKGIESAPDWNISRDRYWGTAIPVWRCDKCSKDQIIGSYEELFQLSGRKLEDYHRPFVDDIQFNCECGGFYKRINQVFDVWFDSGSMPYGERHYPFENTQDFSLKFPADYIAEYIAQTRGWFYVLHVIAVGLFDTPAFKNVVTTGVIAGEDGRKMSKSLANYTDPKRILNDYGADALRFYLMHSPIMEAQNINFSTKDVEEIKRGPLRTLWNSYSFFVTYATLDGYNEKKFDKVFLSKPGNILDVWILSELNHLIVEFESKMDSYQIAKAARLIPEFIDKLSNWYIRRSRKRFWRSGDSEDKDEAYLTLYQVLINFSKLAASFIPFITEEIYRNLTKRDSIHLDEFPKADKRMIDKSLMEKMQLVRNIVKLALALRAKAGIKVRQPLSRIYINKQEIADDAELMKIIQEEVNVKNFAFQKEINKRKNIEINEEGDLQVGLNINVTLNLKREGEAREIIRHIQEMRRKAGYEIDDRIVVNYKGGERTFGKFSKEIARETLAKVLTPGSLYDPDIKEDIKLGNSIISIEINRVEK